MVRRALSKWHHEKFGDPDRRIKVLQSQVGNNFRKNADENNSNQSVNCILL